MGPWLLAENSVFRRQASNRLPRVFCHRLGNHDMVVVVAETGLARKQPHEHPSGFHVFEAYNALIVIQLENIYQ